LLMFGLLVFNYWSDVRVGCKTVRYPIKVLPE
jgi:hypothetical protein